MDKHERRILVITCFGHFISHYNMLVFPALVLPLATQQGLELSRVLEISFWMYLLFGLTALPWGLAADRWGAGRLLSLFFLGSGISAAAAIFCLDSPGRLSLALAGVGLFSGIYHPAGLGLISKHVKRVSMAMGYNGMFGNLGLAAAPLLTGLVNWLWGMQAALAVIVLLNLAGLFLMSMMPLPQNTKGVKSSKHFASTERWLPFMVLLGAMMLGGLAYRGSSVVLPALFELNVLPSFASFSEGFSPNLLATTLTAAVYLVGVLAQYIGGRVGERYNTKWTYLLFHSLSVPAALLAGMFSGFALGLLIFVYLFLLLGMQPIENTLVGEVTSPAFRHAAFGLKFVFTFGVGALAVKLMGMVQEYWSLAMVMPALGLISLCLAGVIILFVWVLKAGSGPARPEPKQPL